MTKLICIDNEHREDGQLTLGKIYYYDSSDFEYLFQLRMDTDTIIDIKNDNGYVEGYFANRFKLYRPVNLPINIRVL